MAMTYHLTARLELAGAPTFLVEQRATKIKKQVGLRPQHLDRFLRGWKAHPFRIPVLLNHDPSIQIGQVKEIRTGLDTIEFRCVTDFDADEYGVSPGMSVITHSPLQLWLHDISATQTPQLQRSRFFPTDQPPMVQRRTQVQQQQWDARSSPRWWWMKASPRDRWL